MKRGVKLMIILHQGIISGSDKKVVGYAFMECAKSYIFSNGEKYQVDFIEPWLKGTSVNEICLLVEDYGSVAQTNHWHLISEHLDVKRSIFVNLKSCGAFYLEDLQNWTDKDYGHVRGFGKKSQMKLQKILLDLGLEYNGTDYLNEKSI